MKITNAKAFLWQGKDTMETAHGSGERGEHLTLQVIRQIPQRPTTQRECVVQVG